MGIAERKAKEKEDLRVLILNGAKEVFVENGFDKTTIRMIAEKVSYSVGTVYVYFRDKNEILHEIQTMGFRKMNNSWLLVEPGCNAMERLKFSGQKYIMFAIENPELYELMFILKPPIDFLKKMEIEWEQGKAAFSHLRDIVRACIEEGHFKGHSLEPLAFIMWSLVHGISSLHLSGRVKAADVQDSDQLIEKAYKEFLLILEKL